MVDAVDQRIALEAALIRLASLEVDNSPAALLERIERLERALASGGAPVPSAAPAAPVSASSRRSEGPAAAGRRAITPTKSAAPTTAPAPVAAAAPTTAPAPAAAMTQDLPSRDDLTLAWGDVLLGKIPRAAKARYTAGRFVEVGANGAVFAVPNAPHMAKCEEFREAVEQVLAEHFGRPVPLVLTVDAAAAPPPAAAPARAAAPVRTVPPPKVEEPEEVLDVHELEDAPADNRTSLDQLAEAFPGAELLPEDNGA
jgi:DNA polymerase-3 subunit gamma/tau